MNFYKSKLGLEHDWFCDRLSLETIFIRTRRVVWRSSEIIFGNRKLGNELKTESLQE
jgi:hypothetical protein